MHWIKQNIIRMGHYRTGHVKQEDIAVLCATSYSITWLLRAIARRRIRALLCLFFILTIRQSALKKLSLPSIKQNFHFIRQSIGRLGPFSE